MVGVLQKKWAVLKKLSDFFFQDELISFNDEVLANDNITLQVTYNLNRSEATSFRLIVWVEFNILLAH